MTLSADELSALVERMREMDDPKTNHFLSFKHERLELVAEAAAALEALAARCATQESVIAINVAEYIKLEKRAEAAEAERDRLRAALKAIEAGYDLDAMPINTYTMQKIARAALSAEQPKEAGE